MVVYRLLGNAVVCVFGCSGECGSKGHLNLGDGSGEERGGSW